MSKLFSGIGTAVGGLITFIPPVTCTSALGSYIATGLGAAVISFFAYKYGKAI